MTEDQNVSKGAGLCVVCGVENDPMTPCFDCRKLACRYHYVIALLDEQGKGPGSLQTVFCATCAAKRGILSMQQKNTNPSPYDNNVTPPPPADFFEDDDDTLSSPVSAPPKKRGLFGALLGEVADGLTGSKKPARSAPVVVQSRPQDKGLTTSTMTQEQLRIRRMNLIEGSKFGRPFHENVMLFVLKFWLVIGPIAFVLLTTSEVAYILTHLVAPGDRNGQTVIWGGALFIDLAMMFTTFGVAIKRRDLAEKREANGGVVSKREEGEVWFGTFLWLIFAIINIVSQAAFLLHVIQSAGSPPAGLQLLYLFVGSRVVGFILGDASTAFFLAKVDNSQLKLLARAEREKGALYKDIAAAEGDRRLTEAKAEAEVRLVQIKVEQEEQDAMFLADLKRQVFTDILNRRSPAPESNGPNRSRLSRSDQ